MHFSHAVSHLAHATTSLPNTRTNSDAPGTIHLNPDVQTPQLPHRPFPEAFCSPALYPLSSAGAACGVAVSTFDIALLYRGILGITLNTSRTSRLCPREFLMHWSILQRMNKPLHARVL